MLVMTRKVGQKVVIPGHGIEISVIMVMRNGQVRLGVKAPMSVGVFREELLKEKHPIAAQT